MTRRPLGTIETTRRRYSPELRVRGIVQAPTHDDTVIEVSIQDPKRSQLDRLPEERRTRRAKLLVGVDGTDLREGDHLAAPPVPPDHIWNPHDGFWYQVDQVSYGVTIGHTFAMATRVDDQEAPPA